MRAYISTHASTHARTRAHTHTLSHTHTQSLRGIHLPRRVIGLVANCISFEVFYVVLVDHEVLIRAEKGADHNSVPCGFKYAVHCHVFYILSPAASTLHILYPAYVRCQPIHILTYTPYPGL